MRHDVTEMIAAIDLRRDRRLMPDPDRTAPVARARDPLGNADGARKAAIGKAPQFAIDQMVGNQAGALRIVTKRGHDADRQMMRVVDCELHDQFRYWGV